MAGRLLGRKLKHQAAAAPTGSSVYFTCRVAVERDDDLVADLQTYLKLFCRRRALIEIDDHRVAVHFEAAGEATIFSGLWTVWAAAGLVPTARCRHHHERARLSSRTAWEE